jgi:hypothetical protein
MIQSWGRALAEKSVAGRTGATAISVVKPSVAHRSMIVPRMTRSSSHASDGSAALDEREDVRDRDRTDDDRAFDDLCALVEQSCTPAATTAARRANQAARELLEQRKTIHEQERLIGSLRSDLAVHGQALLRSEDKRRGLEGELADLQTKLHAVERKAARSEARAARARELTSVALADKELAIRRGEDAVRRAEHRHTRDLAVERDRGAQEIAEHVDRALSAQQIELDERTAEVAHLAEALASERKARAAERERHLNDVAEHERAFAELLAQHAKILAEQESAHRSELAASERAIALVNAHVEKLKALLVVEREAVAASVAAHARALGTAKDNLAKALAERDSVHLADTRARAQAHRAEMAERCAKAEEAGKARAATAHVRIAATMTARLRDAEQSLAEARASHARQIADLRLQLAGLRESTAAERRLAQHAIDLHARARAEVADVRHALEMAQREADIREAARNEAQADLDRFLACSRDTLDESGVRLACGQAARDELEDTIERDNDDELLARRARG